MLALSASSMDLFSMAELQMAVKQVARALFSCSAFLILFVISVSFVCFLVDMVFLSPGVPVKR